MIKSIKNILIHLKLKKMNKDNILNYNNNVIVIFNYILIYIKINIIMNIIIVKNINPNDKKLK